MKKVKMLMILTAVLLLTLPTAVFAGGASETGSTQAAASGPIIVGSNSAPRTLNPFVLPQPAGFDCHKPYLQQLR